MRTDIPTLAAMIREHGWSRRSSLFQEMVRHYAELSCLVESGEATITGIGRALVAQGARSRHGQVPSDRTLRQTWRRVVKLQRERAGKPMAEPSLEASRPVRTDQTAPGVRLEAATPPPQPATDPEPGGFVLPDTDLDAKRPWVAGRKP